MATIPQIERDEESGGKNEKAIAVKGVDELAQYLNIETE